MKRREFIQKNLKIGAGILLLPGLLSSCTNNKSIVIPDVKFNGKVIIVGAGAAGLVAGYILNENGIDFEIIEASSRFGGRVKRIESFSDFPIDLGGEWIHTDPSILSELLGKPEAKFGEELIKYNPKSIYNWEDNNLINMSHLSAIYSEYKFKNSTWYGYFEKYIVPGISNKIIYDSPVSEIDYSKDKIRVKNNNNEIFEADKLLVTIPVSMLKTKFISFLPDLPLEKIATLNAVEMPPGIKVFIEFSEKFYPDLIFHGITALETGLNYKTFYDAAFKKDSNYNILGLFTTGYPASIYSNMATGQEMIEKIIGELDSMFEG